MERFDERFAFAADGGAPLLDVALERGARLPFGIVRDVLRPPARGQRRSESESEQL